MQKLPELFDVLQVGDDQLLVVADVDAADAQQAADIGGPRVREARVGLGRAHGGRVVPLRHVSTVLSGLGDQSELNLKVQALFQIFPVKYFCHWIEFISSLVFI